MDEPSDPERFAQRCQAKRMRKAIKKEGVCSACKYRDKTFGVWHCQNSPDRQYPKCESDGGAGRFTFDVAVLPRFASGGSNG